MRLGDVVVGDLIRQGRLVAILQNYNDGEAMPLSAVMAPGTQRIPRNRVFVDFLIETFGSSPWRCGSNTAHPPVENKPAA
jgi:DNA-binding transcriptional LysR family regulator